MVCNSTSLTAVQAKLKPAKVFKNAVDNPAPATPTQRPSNQGPKQITSLGFDDKGEFVITAAEDETFRLYNCKSGKQVVPSDLLSSGD
mgnify:CR=1 FL=1